jgi:hypothetical protein
MLRILYLCIKDNAKYKRSCNCDIWWELQSHSDQENLDLYLASKKPINMFDKKQKPYTDLLGKPIELLKELL